ncbi:MAG: deoxyribonuclease IV [bacterium]|nr:deoxyribonuclease IV [bacterium]
MLLGAHVSIAGGVDKAPARGAQIGCTAIQIFTKNQRQWDAPPLSQKEIRGFQQALADSPIECVVAHASYLINLCSPDKNQLHKSLESFILELERAESLKIRSYIFHPGSHKELDLKVGIELIAESLDFIIERCAGFNTEIVLETTAGQGTSIGFEFCQLREIINLVDQNHKLGVCLDTSHIFAAGYDLRTPAAYKNTMSAFDREIGFDRLKAIHLNDSRKEFDSRLDRHERIGQGKIGLAAFGFIINDPVFNQIPKLIEIPGGMESDQQDLMLLKSMITSDEG